jgi:hypothetical protein
VLTKNRIDSPARTLVRDAKPSIQGERYFVLGSTSHFVNIQSEVPGRAFSAAMIPEPLAGPTGAPPCACANWPATVHAPDAAKNSRRWKPRSGRRPPVLPLIIAPRRCI